MTHDPANQRAACRPCDFTNQSAKEIQFLPSHAEGYVLIAVYLFICMRVIRISQKVFNRIAWHLVGWLVIILGLDFGIDRVKGQGHEKVKIFFLSLRQFISNWHATNANMFIIQCPILWYVKVCALPSARSSLCGFYIFFNLCGTK